jgi:hypothetical protein
MDFVVKLPRGELVTSSDLTIINESVHIGWYVDGYYLVFLLEGVSIGKGLYVLDAKH